MSDMVASATLDQDELDRRWAMVLPYHDRALRVAFARTGNRADAEDIASETLIRVVTVADLREDTVGGLVSTVAIRLALDVHRREASGRRLEARCGSGLLLPGVDEAVVDKGEASWLHGVVKDLLALEREVMLYRAAGHTNGSAAETLGVTYKSVASAYTRARTSVKHAWRATLGIIIWITTGARRGGSRAQPVVASASLAAVALTLAILQGTAGGPLGPDGGSVSTPGASTHVAVVPVLAGPAPSSAAVAPRSAPMTLPARTSSTPPAVRKRTVVDTGPVGDPRLIQAAARVTSRHEDETTVQTLQRCLDKGLDVGIHRVACRD